MNDWTYIDFVTLLYVKAIQSDFRVTESETEFVLKKVSLNQFNKIEKYAQKLSDHETSDLIADLSKEFCTSESDKNKLLEELKTLLYADDNYSDQEQLFFVGVKKLIQ